MLNTICNICGSKNFQDFGSTFNIGGKPRKNAQCSQCHSLERHRALYFFLQHNGLLEGKVGVNRCLHLAPEKVTHDYLLKAYGAGYYTADLSPEKYQHAECLKLQVPDGFDIFPNEYFTLIVHNHVLEHLPGSFKTHIDVFYRLLAHNGIMVFTIPDYRIIQGVKETIEGGEFLPSDRDRFRIHGQEDHFKTFGTDLLEYVKTNFTKGEALLLEDSDLKKKLKNEHNAESVIFWCVK